MGYKVTCDMCAVADIETVIPYNDQTHITIDGGSSVEPRYVVCVKCAADVRQLITGSRIAK